MLDTCCIQVRRATTDRSVVYGNVVEATRATLKQALNDAPAFTSQVFPLPSRLEYTSNYLSSERHNSREPNHKGRQICSLIRHSPYDGRHSVLSLERERKPWHVQVQVNQVFAIVVSCTPNLWLFSHRSN